MKRALLPIQLGTHWLALDASHASEVLGRKSWVSVPGAGAYIPGVTSWRGRAVAVVDLGVLCEIAQPLTPEAAHERTLILRVGACTLALMVDGIREVMPVDAEAIRPVHATVLPYASSELELDGRAIPLLDLQGMLKAILPSLPEAR